MDQARWEQLLRQWSNDILESDEFAGLIPPDVVAARWLGYPGATEAEIAQAEARLGVTLPPSYRAFLRVSNGWRMTSSFIDQLWSTDQIGWFRDRNQSWINAFVAPRRPLRTPSTPDAQYFVYGDQQDPTELRVEYLQSALEISAIGDAAIYLLNPEVVTPEGEWEAWLFASWLPGANRYRSFWELMQAEHAEFLRSS